MSLEFREQPAGQPWRSVPVSRTTPLPVDPLGRLGVARQLAVTTANNNVELTATCRRLSLYARGCDMRLAVGTGAQTADASTSHFIAQNERIDISVLEPANLAAIRASHASTNGTLEVTELA